MFASAIRAVACAVVLIGCSGAGRAADRDDWPDYRHDWSRTGEQEDRSALSDPAKVPSLAVRWQWPPTARRGRLVSRIAYRHRRPCSYRQHKRPVLRTRC